MGQALLSVDAVLPTFISHHAPFAVKLAFVVTALVLLFGCALRFVPGLRSAIVFAYICFIQPIGKVANQGERLDKFYQNQASGECHFTSS